MFPPGNRNVDDGENERHRKDDEKLGDDPGAPKRTETGRDEVKAVTEGEREAHERPQNGVYEIGLHDFARVVCGLAVHPEVHGAAEGRRKPYRSVLGGFDVQNGKRRLHAHVKRGCRDKKGVKQCCGIGHKSG